MIDTVSQFLLNPSPSRLNPSPLHRFRPPPNQPLAWSLVLLHALYTGLLLGGALALGARLVTTRWYPESFGFGATYGFLAGFLWALVVRLVWNRRRQALQTLATTSQPSQEPVPVAGWRRLIPPLYTLCFVTVTAALCISLENVRGSLALRSFQNELRARGEPTSLSEVLPPPIPDDQNLASIPILKRLLEKGEQTDGRRPVGNNPQPKDRQILIEDRSVSFRAFASKHGRKPTGFMEGQPTDLPMWQTYYQSLTNWPQLPASPPPTAAQTVLHALSRYDPELQELRQGAATHPQARFPLNFEGSYYQMRLEHLSLLKGCTYTLTLRASALLADNRPEEALADLRLAQRLIDALREEPLLISCLVQWSLETITLQPIWEGCTSHRWTADHLHQLRGLLAARQPIPSLVQALRGERVYASTHLHRLARYSFALFLPDDLDDAIEDEIRTVLRFTPRGWIHRNDIAQGRYILALTDALASASTHRQFPPKGTLLTRTIDPKSPYSLLASLVAPGFDNAPHRAYEQEAWRRMALVGIALEEYRLTEGAYPQTLTDLTTRFPEVPAQDPMNGDPLHYTRTHTGDYHLYSVGLDHQDDDGKRADRRARSNREPRKPSDLVWR